MNLEKWIFITVLFLLPLVLIFLPIWPWNRRRIQTWIVHGYYGTGRVILGKMTRERAIRMTTKDFGTVMFVDDANGFIFYKPKESKS